MRRNEILGATPEQLRVWVAEYVMGWEKTYSPDPSIWAWRLPGGGGCTEEAWNLGIVGNWVENMTHAWEVVESWEYNWNIVRDVGKCGDDYETEGDGQFHVILAYPGMPMAGTKADRAPEAICKAALLAVMGGE